MSSSSFSVANRLLLPTLLSALLAVGCGSSHPKTGPQSGMAGRAVPVRVKTVSDRPVGEFTEYLATLISRGSAVLQPDVEGQVTRIFVHSGQHVKQGEPLLEINPLKQQATVRTNEANQRAREADLALAKQNLQRTQGLYKDGIIARQQLDQAQAAYDAAVANANANQASIAEQQAQLHYYTVRAPTAGIVGDIPVHVGDHVTTSTQLTSVVAPGSLEAYIYVPAENAVQAKPGLKVTISADDNQLPVTTSVDFISPRVDPQSQLLLIKAQVPNPNGRFRNEEEVHALRLRRFLGEWQGCCPPGTNRARAGSRQRLRCSQWHQVRRAGGGFRYADAP
jgi:RND family efflux transporter MFP subunit